MKVLYLDHDKQIPYHDILYFEHYHKFENSLNRITILYTTNQQYILRNKIKDIFLSLDPTEFMMPHQSFIVNMRYIQVFSQSHLLLDNNKRIPISIKRAAIVRIQFLDYIQKKRA